MSSIIRILCFDINNGCKKDSKENILELENPLRILDEFQDIHLFFDSEKIQVNSSEIKYKFLVNFSKKNQIIFEIFILNDLTFIHNVSLNADANLIFINLENQETLNKLENIVEYIHNYCFSVENITYLIGIYKNSINPILDNESIGSLFEEKDLNCEIYQIKYNDKGGPNHKCIYHNNEMKNKKNANKKKKSTNNDNIDNYNIFEIVEKILIKMYEKKINIKNIKNDNKDDNNKGNSMSDSGKNNCIIF